MPQLVFLDTTGLLAIVRTNDSLHQRAAAALMKLGEERARLVTSDWVLSEFLAGAAYPPLRRGALVLVDQLLSSPAARVHPATRRAFAEALDLYRSRPDKEWSLVDCSSMLPCQRRGIQRVLTHDRHFAQAGFKVLL